MNGAGSKNKKIKKVLKTKDLKRVNFNRVKEEITSIIAKVAKVDRSEIKEDININEQLGIESLHAVEILAAIETKFGIKIDSAKAFNVVTIKDFYKLVKSYL